MFKFLRKKCLRAKYAFLKLVELFNFTTLSVYHLIYCCVIEVNYILTQHTALGSGALDRIETPDVVRSVLCLDDSQ